MRSFRRRVLAFAPLLVLASCAIRPSTVPLGGTDAPAPPPKRSTQTGADRVDDAAEASPDRDAADQHEPVPGTSATTTGSSDETETPRDPGAIYFNPIPFKKGTVCEQNQHVEMEMLMSPPGGIASGQIPVSASQEQKARITVTKMDGTNIAKARVEFLDVAEEMTIEMGILGKKSDRRKGDTDGRTFDVDWSSSSVRVTSPDGKEVSEDDAHYATDAANVLRFQQALPTKEPVKSGWVLDTPDVISKILGDDVQIEEGRLKLREVATQSGAEVALFDLEADFTQRDSEGVIESEVKGSVSVAVDGTRVQSIEFAGPMRATMDELEGLSLEGEMTMRSEYRCRD